MRLPRRLLLSTAATLALAAAAGGLAAASAARADSGLPNLTGFHQMVVDSTDGHVFISGTVGGSSAIMVTDLTGQYVATLDSGAGVQGLALDGGTLYAALRAPGQIAVINAATLSQASPYALPSGDLPYALAVQSGKLWVSYDDQPTPPSGAIGDIDLSTGTFEAASAPSDASWWYAAPDIAADPANAGVLVAVQQDQSIARAETYNTSVTPVAILGGPALLGTCGNEGQLAVVSGGAQFIAACSAPYSAGEFSTVNLATPTRQLSTGPYPAAVAIAPDGTIAVGNAILNPGVHVYRPDGTAVNAFPISPADLPAGALAWPDDGSAVFAVTASSSSSYSLRVFGSPEITRTALTLSGPSTAVAGVPVSLTGKLAFSLGAPPAGTAVAVTRTNPDNSVTTLTTAQTDASGNITVSDTPPSTGAYTYTAAYAGNASTASAQATASVSVALNTAQLTLSAPATSVLASGITISGKLTLGTGAPPASTAVAITRTNPDKSVTTLATAQTDPSGNITLNDTPPALGAYTYTASYAGDADTNPAQATASVTVALNTATLTLTGAATVVPLRTYTLVGRLAFGTGSPGAGIPVTVTRKNPNGSTTAITGIKTGSGSAFTITDRQSVLGAYTYTASYAGNATTTRATASLKVTIARAAAPLTLTTTPVTALYGSTIKVQAHLGGTYSNRTVSLYYLLVGTSGRRLIETAKVSSNGYLTYYYKPATRNVIFTATFSGDAQYLARSVSVRDGVAVRVAMTNGGYFASNTFNGVTYRVYHHTGRLTATIAVTPAKPGECVKLVVQELVNGAWLSNVTTGCGILNSSSRVGGVLTLAGADLGFRYRVRAVFYPSSKDVTNVSYFSGWFYFQVVR